MKLRAGSTFFQRDNGEPIWHEVFTRQYFAKDVQQAGLKRIRFHDLRHTATTLLIASGLDLKTVKEICGHKDIATTMGYTHLLGNSVRDVARTYGISGRQSTLPPPSAPVETIIPRLRLVR